MAQKLSGLTTQTINIEDFRDVAIFTGVVECVFKGDGADITRNTLSFLIPSEFSKPLRLAINRFHQAGGIVSLASFAYDGAVSNALWAVDKTTVQLALLDSGTGTASLEVSADLAVRGLNGIVLRLSYTVFVSTSSGGIKVDDRGTPISVL